MLLFILKGLPMKKVVITALCLFAFEMQGAQHRRRNSSNNNDNNNTYENSYDPRPTSTKRPPHYDDFNQNEQKRQEDARAQMTKAIAQKFDRYGEETFTAETFKDLASQATPERPFFLAVIAAPKGNYHFFSAPELAAYGKTQNPINRKHIQQIIIYRYNGEEKSDFPFDYEETINAAQMPDFHGKYKPHSRL